jgi:lipopolysaccharide export system permease protein
MRRVLGLTVALTIAAMLVLLLGRLGGLFEMLAGPQGAFGNVGAMLLFLIPHLLGLALPVAFFFGVLLTFDRLSQDNEIIVLMASGWSLQRLLRPMLVLTVALLVIVTIILGFAAPYARYAYRSVKYTVTQATLLGSVREGTFAQVGDVTFYADQVEFHDTFVDLLDLFVVAVSESGKSVTTAPRGRLAESRDGARQVLILEDGQSTSFAPDGTSRGTFSFHQSIQPVEVPGLEGYGPRGRDQRELTIVELWSARSNPRGKPSPAEISAELNTRLVMIASLPMLPFIGMSLGLRQPRRSNYRGITGGLLLVIIYFQVIGFGEALTKREVLPAAVALWLPFAVFAGIALWLFWRASEIGASWRRMASARHTDPHRGAYSQRGPKC